MKKILLFLSIFFMPYLVNASSMYQEIDILENGDIKVKESISLDGSYNGFKLTLEYKYYDKNMIYSADDLEVVRVCESNKDNPLEDILECFDEVSSASIGDSLKYTHQDDDADTFMLYNPSSRHTAFYIEYILKNVVVSHNDINELKLNMISQSFNEDLDILNIKVNLPSEANDLRAWAHGPLWGNIEVDDNKKYAVFTIDDFEKYTMVDIRLAFDKDIVITDKVTNMDYLDQIIEEETQLAEEANKKREEYKQLIEEREKYEKEQKRNSIILSLIWGVAAIFLFLSYYFKYDKEYKSDFNAKYLRDFPSEHSPELIQYLMEGKITEVGLSASILNIVYKKGFIVDKFYNEGGVVKKTKKEDYKFTVNDKNLKEPLTEEEIELRSWLSSAFGKNNSFMLSDIKKAGTSESKARKFINKFNTWKTSVVEKAKEEDFFIDSGGRKFILILFSLIPAIIAYAYIDYNPFMLIMFCVPVVCAIYIGKSSKRTLKGNSLYVRWLALKNFMKDFGTFEEKELPEISLWEKYLVYAHVFGLAEELRKQMEIKMPNTEALGDSFSTYDYIAINNALNKSITTTVSAAISSANTKIASSNMSSGSGSGGGFSGGSSGGGFSGGGGSGGGRF